MRLQQEGYSKQITNLLDDLNKLNNMKNVDKHDTKVKELKIDDSAIDEESLTTNTANALTQPNANMSHFTSTAEFYTTKTITVPSHEASNIFLIDSDKNEDDPFMTPVNKSVNITTQTDIEATTQLRQRIDDLEKQLIEQNELRNQIENLQTRLVFEQNERSQKMLAERAQYQAQLDALQTKLNEYNQNLQTTLVERAQLQSQVDVLQNRLVDQNQLRNQIDYLQKKIIEQNELQNQMDHLQRKYDELFGLYERTQKENEYMKTREKEFLAEREKSRDITNKLELDLQKLKQKEFYMEERYQEKCNQEMHRQRDELEKSQRSSNEKEMQKLLEKLNEQLEQTMSEKKSIENQLNLIHAELRTYQSDNMMLTNKYEKQVHNLNEQLKMFQV